VRSMASSDLETVRAGLLDGRNALVPGTMTEREFDALRALERIERACVSMRNMLLRGSPGWLDTGAGKLLLEVLGDK
jgi:hypothetical protein